VTDPTTPICIVGAGPTGLTLAGELLRRGVACRVVDKASAPGKESRAIGVHSRTLEVLDAVGLADELIERGVKVHGGSIYTAGKRIANLTFDELDAPFPFMLAVPQTDTEELLRKNVELHGGKIEWSTTLSKLEENDGGVTLELVRPDGSTERGRAPWVVGCDGAHSAVRHALDLSFDGAPYPENIVLADVKLESTYSTDEAHTFLTDDGVVVIAPLPHGRARVIATLPAEAEPPKDAPPPQLSELQAILDRHVTRTPKMSDCVWISRFRVHHRLVSDYRKGRVFLAGDAAHIHSPAGGQGMNTGIQDAFNLGWKLALVAQGRGRPSLLDSYGPERRAIAEAVVAGTDATMKVMTLRHPIARGLRDRAMSYLTSLEVVQERISKTASGIGLGYRKSPIVGEYRSSVLDATISSSGTSERPSVVDWRDFGAAPAPGSRALDEMVFPEGKPPERLLRWIRGTGHALLLFDGRAATSEGYKNLDKIAATVTQRFPELVTVHVVVPLEERPKELHWRGSVLLDATCQLHHRYGAGSESLYLIRPDGYVGYRSQPARLEDLLAYLEGKLFVR
jgi:2-polyprenyl-6-methoxyphenol hydroxylase-like FAD-dependent oxidoreductase